MEDILKILTNKTEINLIFRLYSHFYAKLTQAL